MRIYGLKFNDPQVQLIKALKEKLPAFHVAAFYPLPGQKQHDALLIVEKQAFAVGESGILREYGVRFILDVRGVSKDVFEELCEDVEYELTSLRGGGIKYVELEGMIEDHFENDIRFRRAYNGFILVQASSAG